MLKTHEMIFFDIKPSDYEISKMIGDYFDAEAATYDHFNQSIDKRRLFLNRIDELIAIDILERRQIQNVLSIACGTCFREERIRKISKLEFSITGVDISGSMCEIAKANSHRVINANWLDVDLHGETFDTIFYLYSLGLLPSLNSRRRNFEKMAACIRSGGILYFDVMNLLDKTEWGPELMSEFYLRGLEKNGYELGDVFYRRIGSDQISFFHYFTFEEVNSLLEACGFQMLRHFFVDCNTKYGEIVGPDEGAILIVAKKL